MFDPDYAQNVMSLANANRMKKINMNNEINRFHQMMKLTPMAIGELTKGEK